MPISLRTAAVGIATLGVLVSLSLHNAVTYKYASHFRSHGHSIERARRGIENLGSASVLPRTAYRITGEPGIWLAYRD